MDAAFPDSSPVEMPPDVVAAIVAPTSDGDAYTQHYFDSRGVVRVYAMTFGKGVWTSASSTTPGRVVLSAPPLDALIGSKRGRRGTGGVGYPTAPAAFCVSGWWHNGRRAGNMHSVSAQIDAEVRKALLKKPPRIGSVAKFALHRAAILAMLTEPSPQREGLIKELMQFAKTHDTARSNDPYGRLLFRIIGLALGTVAIGTVGLAFVLVLQGKTVNAAFYTLGASAIGGLAGVLAPRPTGSADPAEHPDPA